MSPITQADSFCQGWQSINRVKWEQLAISFREVALGVAGKISDACWSAQSREEVFALIDKEMREMLSVC